MGWDAGRTLGLWDARTGDLVRRFEGHTHNVIDHAFSPDGTRLVSASVEGGTVRMWDVATGRSVWTFERARAKGVAFSPDGRRIGVVAGDGGAEVRDARSGDLLQTLRGDRGNPFAIAFSPDGTRVAIGGDGAEVFDVTTGDQLLALRGHEHVVADIAFTAGGDEVVTSSEDDTTRVWSAGFPGGRELANLPAPPPPAVGTLAFSPDGTLLATSAPDGIRLVDAQTRETVRTLSAPDPAVQRLAFSPDGSRLAASTFVPPPRPGVPGTLTVWDLDSGEQLWTSTSDAMLRDVTFSPDGSWIATGTDN